VGAAIFDIRILGNFLWFTIALCTLKSEKQYNFHIFLPKESPYNWESLSINQKLEGEGWRAMDTPLNEESGSEVWRVLETPLQVLFSRSSSVLVSYFLRAFKRLSIQLWFLYTCLLLACF
jgi:hypothetical protein